MKLNYKYAKKWLKKLKTYWFNKDVNKAVDLFKNTSYYQETPFTNSYTSFKEILNEWEHIKNEDIKEIKIDILAIDNNILIAHWYLEQNKDIFDGVYEIKFNDNLECTYFKSWEMKKDT